MRLHWVLLPLAISFLSLHAWACRDLSGQYNFTSGSLARLTITQTGCDFIDLTISRPPYVDSVTVSYKTDGTNYQDAYFSQVDKKSNVNWTTPGEANEDTASFHRAEIIGDALLVKQFEGSQKSCGGTYTFFAKQTCYMTIDNYQLDSLDLTGNTLIKVQIGYFRDGLTYSSDETHAQREVSR
jgi:hypothetical protein